ncbi:ester cyclase [Paenibacillus sp. GCM10027627]|uniref:ester cyclase n=1 Tax=unclassified Paenibacillus TaxID=185978 RepID=UPI00362C761A
MTYATETSNKEIVTAFIELFWNQSNWSCLETYLSDDYKELSYQSKEGLVRFAKMILEAFPDKQYTLEKMTAQENQVLVRMTVKGTQQGIFFGSPPTGKAIDITLYRQYRIADGKIAEHRGWIDMVTMKRQLQVE